MSQNNRVAISSMNLQKWIQDNDMLDVYLHLLVEHMGVTLYMNNSLSK